MFHYNNPALVIHHSYAICVLCLLSSYHSGGMIWHYEMGIIVGLKQTAIKYNEVVINSQWTQQNI